MKKLFFFLFLFPALASGQNLTTKINSTIRGKIYDYTRAGDMFQAFVDSLHAAMGGLANEIPKSNGLHYSTGSGLFNPSLGQYNFGTGLSGAVRTLIADGSSSVIDWNFTNKGGGSVFQFNTTVGSAVLKAGGAATAFIFYGGVSGVLLGTSSANKVLTATSDLTSATLTTSSTTVLNVKTVDETVTSNVNLKSGDASAGNSGDITIQTGTASGTRGNINLNAPSVTVNGSPIPPIIQAVAASDETTAIVTGNGKVTFRIPVAMTITSVTASLTTAQPAGSIFTIDVKKNGTTIFSTLLTIDNTELTSTTAATPAVLSVTSIAADDAIRVDVTQVGTAGAAGLKIYIIGR